MRAPSATPQDDVRVEALPIEKAHTLIRGLQTQIEQVILGQRELVVEALCTFLAGGHLLITGAPGLAKTTLVRVIAEKLGLAFGRVQFTPDLLPGDITGAEILNLDPDSGRKAFSFMPGPIFVNLLLADEINRASPRTQSAMLEAMQERQITSAGQTYALPAPFMVFATQNPFDAEGTFALPEAQLDRFLLHSLVNYPSAEAELQILTEFSKNTLTGSQNQDGPSSTSSAPASSLSHTEIRQLLTLTSQIPLRPELLQAITILIRTSRPQEASCPPEFQGLLWYGAGPRAGLSLIAASRALALLEQEECVRWRHIRRMAKPALRHRLRLSLQARHGEQQEDALVEALLEQVEKTYTQVLQF